MKLFKALYVLLFFIVLTGCFNNRWTDKQRKQFETKCSQTETFNNISIKFRGFDNSEFESILVKEFNGNLLLDSFRVFAKPGQNAYNKERSATIERTMNIKYKYLFIIPGQEPYELANMKMVMWSQWTMTSEGYGCVMGEYTIDGAKFEHNANPTFIKRVAVENK